MRTVVIGTAGHIDHGKTALLRALTGIDADRLPEEQARGMTIDVGYAHIVFEDGVELDFVDVPGHDRLIGNMLVGAGEIDAALLVVAADDGPRPQTIEHLQLLDALGIADGLAVVTKVDLVDRARVDEVIGQVGALLAPTPLAGTPVVAASAVSREGIDGLRVALRALRDRVATRDEPGGTPPADGPLRLAVDRAFSVKGRGAVVTGSLRGGTLERGATLRREPGGEPVRIREVQVHGDPRERADGGRTALNIAGLAADDLHRGDVLTAPARTGSEAIAASDRLLVRLRAPAGIGTTSGRAPKGGSHLRLHIGTDQVDATVRRLAGSSDVALLTLARPTATYAGDRGVLREPAAGAVVAGARVLDARPPRGASRRRMTPERLTALAGALEEASRPAIDQALLGLHGAVSGDSHPDRAPAAGALRLAADVRMALADAALEAVAAHRGDAPLSAGLPLPRARAALLRRLRALVTIERRDADAAAATVAGLIDGLVADGRITRRGDALADPSLANGLPAELEAAMERLESALAVAAPPPLAAAAAEAGCPLEGVRALQADGRIIRIGADLAWAASTYQALAAVALDRARAAPLTPAAFRDLTGTSRRYVLAILEDLDRRGILQRTPEGHIPGARAPGRGAAT
jgi:selenocysteine-specific elongation factor